MFLSFAHLRDSSQSFRGFDAHDVKQSLSMSSAKIELHDIPLSKIAEIDEEHIEDTTSVHSLSVIKPLPNNVSETDADTDNTDMDQSDQQKLIVDEIVGEVVETIVQDGKVCVDREATTELADQIGSAAIPMPKDDPETAFFLSLS